MSNRTSTEFLIVGSGFGGAFSAYNLARAGRDVLVLDRGVWAARDDSAWDEVRLHIENPLYRGRTPFHVDQGKEREPEEVWPDDTVGGMSVFYGAAAFRMREEDFLGAPQEGSPERDPRTAWPIGYEDMEPYYGQAEALQGVAGKAGEDITEPPRSTPFPQPAPDLTPPATRLWKAAERLGLHPARIPLAINFDGASGKGTCVLCNTCDHFICKVEAKNDLSVAVLPAAMAAGAEILPDTRVLRINTSEGTARSVDVVRQSTGERWTIRADHVIVAGGALSSPRLLLASGIRGHGSGADLLGRNLMRHVNCVVSGLLPRPANPDRLFHKMVHVPDFYHGVGGGGPSGGSRSSGSAGDDVPPGPLGLLQDIHTPGPAVLRANTPFGLRTLAVLASRFLLNVLCIGEDVPRLENRVYLDSKEVDVFGVPRARVFHRYAPRDLAVRRVLAGKAKRLLRAAGAFPVHTLPIETFSHAFGTCRFGSDPETSVLDENCRVWGFDNLYVVDASFMPSGGSVNPSLTIGANALRVTSSLVRG